MGVPTSEVGYTIATTRRETTNVHKNMWWHWGWGAAGKFQLLVEMWDQSDVQLRACLSMHLFKPTGHSFLLCDTLTVPVGLYPVIMVSAPPPVMCLIFIMLLLLIQQFTFCFRLLMCVWHQDRKLSRNSLRINSFCKHFPAFIGKEFCKYT